MPNVLAKKNFRIREMTKSDLIRNTLRNVLSHPIGFLRAEFKTRTLIKALKGVYKVPALHERNIRIIYALRKMA